MSKRLLSLFLVLIMVVGVLASCGKGIDQDLQDATTYLQQSYKNADSKTKTATASSYTLMPSVRVDKASFNIDWSIKESGLKNVKFEMVDGKPTVTIVDSESETREDYTLVAKLTSEDGKSSATVEFERYYPAFKPVSFEEWVAQIDTGVAVTVKGHIIGNVYLNDPKSTSSSKGCLYIQDDTGHGFYAYAPKYPEGQTSADYQVGEEVYVNGLPTNYNGQYEFKSGCSVRKSGGASVEYKNLQVINATADFEKAVNNKDAKLADYQNTLVTLDNCLLTRISGSYYYFALGNSEFNVYYNTYFLTEAELAQLKKDFVVGKSCTITGLVSVYSSAYQIYVTQVDTISNIADPTLTDQEYVDLARKIGSCEESFSEYPAELPTSMISGKVNITWAVPEEFKDIVTITDGKLTLAEDVDAKTEISLVATYSCGEAEQKSRRFDTVVVPEVKQAMTVKEAIALVDALEDNAWTDSPILVRGLVSTSSYNSKYSSYTIWFTDGETEKAFELYSVAFADDVFGDYTEADALKGKYVTCKGYAKKYVSSKDNSVTLEIAFDNAKGTPQITMVELNVKEAMEVVGALADNAWTDKPISVTGVVSTSSYSSKYSSYTIWLTDGETEKAFELYSVAIKGVEGDFTANDALKGYTVTCTGYAKKYVSSKDNSVTLEVAFDNAKGTPAITTAEPPVITVAEAIALVNALEDNAWTTNKIAVKGVVSTSSYNSKYTSYTIWLKDGETEKAFELYSVVAGSAVTGDFSAADSLKDCTVTCVGYAKKYVSSKDNSVTLEIAFDNAKGSPVITEVVLPLKD